MILMAFLAAFIAGAVLGYDQDSGVIKKPLYSTLSKYQPSATENGDEADFALKEAWDTIQTEVKIPTKNQKNLTSPLTLNST